MPANQPGAEGRYLPLKPVVFHILLALAEGDAHGYGVIQSVRTHTSSRIHLETGPFYRHLRKLMDRGWVEESADRPAEDDPRRGAYYRLTPLGLEVLMAESRRMAEVVSLTTEMGLVAGEGTG
ncbi:MAG: PadR family transcriptional regulator [Longimicrobiales bacterium]